MLKNRIEIMSRETVEDLISEGFPDNVAVISFYDPPSGKMLKDYGPVDYSHVCSRFFSVPIHDIDLDILSEFGLTFETYFPEARALAQFIMENIANGLNLICQCEYGQSRSAACAAAIKEYYEKGELKFSLTIGITQISLFLISCYGHSERRLRKMVLYDLKRKLRRKRVARYMESSGMAYHHHSREVVVSENELLIQLQECSIHTNLLALLVYGEALPNYKTALMRAALKFEFLGSLVFPVDERNVHKPPAKVYARELFRGSYENVDEVRRRIQSLVSFPVSYRFARNIFRRLAFLIKTCCILMSQTTEIWGENSYRVLIEHAISQDADLLPDVDHLRQVYRVIGSEDYGGRRDLRKQLPEDFMKNVACRDVFENSFRR